ncbi:MAG: HAD-IA family hydrolase [Planctomycetes bacterium]|nr:HAD-IA family hydrolase [Planctomycetota bacterium]MBM4057052.1 HAD-IA family hydrolase [Planctomycetota bacterium]
MVRLVEPPQATVFPPPGVRAVVFDVVHTLVEPAPDVAVVYHRTALQHGVNLGPAVIRDRFRAAWKRQEEIDAASRPAHATSRSRETERWRRIVADVFPGTTAAEAIFTDLWSHFGRPDAWRTLSAGRDLLLAARAAGLPVALASNFDERLLGLAGQLEPLTLADHVFASSEIGWRKPAPQFFRIVEERLGLSPDRLLLVGDDPLLDVSAARRAGWHVRAVG